MLAMLSYTHTVWTLGFRPLIKQEVPSIMEPWHIHVTKSRKYYPQNFCGMCSFNGSNYFHALIPSLMTATWILVHKLSRLHKTLILLRHFS